MTLKVLFLGWFIGVAWLNAACAQEDRQLPGVTSGQANENEESLGSQVEGIAQMPGHWNLSLRTWGGKQWWTDYVWLHDYRIQKHAATGHFRLIDPRRVRRCWGSLEDCQAALSEIAQQEKLKPVEGKVVVILHGLGRTRESMKSLALAAEKEGWQTIRFGYASTRAGMADHAAALRSVIDHLSDVKEFYFVGHSLGNMVVRRYLGSLEEPDKRFMRMVMLAPPNQGSQMANVLKRNMVFRSVAGKSGQELSAQWQETQGKLATPGFPFAIIAGGQQKTGSFFSNAFIQGRDDLIVGVEETKLPGAADFLVVNSIHTTIMNQEQVHECTLRFFREGHLVTAEAMQPLPRVAADSQAKPSAPLSDEGG